MILPKLDEEFAVSFNVEPAGCAYCPVTVKLFVPTSSVVKFMLPLIVGVPPSIVIVPHVAEAPAFTINDEVPSIVSVVVLKLEPAPDIVRLGS